MLAPCSDRIALTRASTPGVFRCSRVSRRPPAVSWPGSATSGTFTLSVLVPLARYSCSLPDTKRAMSSRASPVATPTRGVRMTLGRPRSSERNTGSAAEGSSGKASMAAPAIRPALIAALSA